MTFFWIDTFTTRAFAGNPTPVFYLTPGVDQQVLPSLARELNQPVTAFVQLADAGRYSIRYFTPQAEIPACGHATLAAAAMVAQMDGLLSMQFLTVQNTRIPAEVHDGRVSLRYPRYGLRETVPSEALLDSMGLEVYEWAGMCHELETLFIVCGLTETLKRLTPDFKQMVSVAGIKEVVVTTLSVEKGQDYLLRSFCPWIGVDEDPVTGSVHAALAPYWSDRLQKRDLHAYQASERGGSFFLQVEDEAVVISGECKVIMEGSSHIS